MTMDEIVWRSDYDVAQFVFAREIHGRQSLDTRRKAVQGIAARGFPLLKPNRAMEFPGMYQCDKIFSACWLDGSNVAMGSKDNQFILWNIFTGTFKAVPIPTIGSDVPHDTCGIHDVDVNHSRSLLATGGHSPLDILIFSRDTMSPTCILKGHHDWVFGSRFIEDDFLVSASRDSTVALWKVRREAPDTAVPLPEVQPLLIRKEHATKVRAIGYHHSKRQIATVSADSVVKIWDRSNMDVVASMEFPHYPEMTCMAVDQTYDLLAVGHQNGVSVLDMRGPTCAMEIQDKQGNTQWGVRSVDIFHHFVSIGGGFGRLSFFDLRNKSYIDMKDGKVSLKTGTGWMDAPPEFERKHAIYCHKFDPSDYKFAPEGGRMLIIGGR